MAFTKNEKITYIIGLIVLMGLVELHVVTGIKGYNYFVDEVQPKSKSSPLFMLLTITYKEYEARVIMLMAVAGLTLLTNLAALLLLFYPKHIKMLHHLNVFNLTIEVGIGLLLAISVYEMSITRDFYIEKIYKTSEVANAAWDADGFNTFWRILIADTVLTFVPQILFLIIFHVAISNQNRNESYLQQLTNDDTSGYNKV